jgi:Ca2+/H+ antiporter, TMEM165/GDT1 family
MNNEFPNRRFRNERKLFFLPAIILMVLLLGAIVYWLWNAILPELIGVKTIKYSQALGLLILCRILFGHFGWRRNSDSGRFRQNFKDRFKNMSDEERQRFRDEWKRRCGK